MRSRSMLVRLDRWRRRRDDDVRDCRDRVAQLDDHLGLERLRHHRDSQDRRAHLRLGRPDHLVRGRLGLGAFRRNLPDHLRLLRRDHRHLVRPAPRRPSLSEHRVQPMRAAAPRAVFLQAATLAG
jgi:hypothetical protein